MREKILGLPGDEFIDAICQHRGLMSEEWQKLDVDYHGIVQGLDRGLRELDGQLGRTLGDPSEGERGVSLGNFGVAMRLTPHGELRRFGREWLPDVVGNVYPRFFTGEAAGVAPDITDLLEPRDVALLLELRLLAGVRGEDVKLWAEGSSLEVRIGEHRIPLRPHGNAFALSRRQPRRIDVVGGKYVEHEVYGISGSERVITISEEAENAADLPTAQTDRLERLADAVAAGSGAVVGIEVDLRRPGMYRLIWSELNTLVRPTDGQSWESLPGLARDRPGIYFTDESIDLLVSDARAGVLPASLSFDQPTPNLPDQDFRGIEESGWVEAHRIGPSPARRPAWFVLVGGPVHVVGLRGELIVDTRQVGDRDLARLTAAAASSARCARLLISVGERVRQQRYGLVISSGFGEDALEAATRAFRQTPRSWWRGESAVQPESREGSDSSVSGGSGLFDAGPAVVVWTGATAKAGEIAEVVDRCGENTEGPVTVVMLHTHETERFARAYNKLTPDHAVRLSSFAEVALPASAVGSVVAASLHPTLVIGPLGDEDGETLSAALDYLDRNYGAAVTPWQVMAHPLLRKRALANVQIPHDEIEATKAELDAARKWYELLTRYVPADIWERIYEPIPESIPSGPHDSPEITVTFKGPFGGR